MLIKLAWRNLWRQKRRTLITAFALAFALLLSLLTRSFQEGSYRSSIESVAKFYTGLAQIQHNDFSQSLSIDDVIPQTESFIAQARTLENVERTLPRVESVALAAHQERSRGVRVIGVDPEKEDAYSGISAKLIDGRFIQADDTQVLIGQGLAQFLNLDVGDEMVLYGQGHQGQVAAGLFQVAGVLAFPIHELDNQLVYLPLRAAQNLYSLNQKVSVWVLDVYDLKQLDQTITALRHIYLNNSVKDWQQLAPELAQQIMMDKIGGIFLIYILYGIVGFGLFSTILMMLLERQREFAVMLATGMARIQLLHLVFIESLLIALLGMSIGLVLACPVMAYFYFYPIRLTGEAADLMIKSGFEPILPTALDLSIIANQIIAVVVIMLLCLVYPLLKISSLSIVSGLKGGKGVT